MTYKFKYRRLNQGWQEAEVIGHSVITKPVRDAEGRRIAIGKDPNGNPVWDTEYDTHQDKMVLYLPDGGVQEICLWSQCEVKLGTDWALAMKKKMEASLGQVIPMNV